MLLLSICPSYRVYAQDKPVRIIEVEVQRGDTLYKFADRYLRDPERWPEIHQYNKGLVENPNLILPRTILKIPLDMLRSEIADIVYFRNQAQIRKKGQTLWTRAILNDRLFSEDAIQTLRDSVAHIRFLRGELVQLKPNSLVILRPEKKEETLELLSGELRASQARVLTATAVVEPSAGMEVQTDFQANVDEDKTTTVKVFKGAVDFTASGKKITIPTGFMSLAKIGHEPIPPLPLPPLPSFDDISVPDAPISDVKTSPHPITTGEVLRQINFSEAKKDYHITGCRLQVSRDEHFASLVMNEIISSEKTGINSAIRSLPDGTYCWRVAYVNAQGTEGDFSGARRFVVDHTLPFLQITEPADDTLVDREFITIRGVTETDCRVLINNTPVSVDAQGNFMGVVYLEFGINRITVSAADSSGNTSVIERTATRTAPRKKFFGKLGAGIGIAAVLGVIGIIIATLL